MHVLIYKKFKLKGKIETEREIHGALFIYFGKFKNFEKNDQNHQKVLRVCKNLT